MSWYTQNLLRDSLRIHSEADLSSDEYNDLIVLEKKIELLFNAEIISNKEMELLRLLKEGKTFTDMLGTVYKDKDIISESIDAVCTKVAFYLGGYFTDEGYVDYMTNKYKLSNEEVERMKSYMKSKYRNKLMRKKRDAV